MPNHLKLGKRIKQLRNEKNLTQTELSKILNFSGKSTLSNYENGYSNPDYEILIKIAEYFGVSTDYLLGITNNPLPLNQIITPGVKAFLQDKELLTLLLDYDEWSKDDKMMIKKIIKAQNIMRRMDKLESK